MRGARSRNELSMRSTHRSPGSLTCESAESNLSAAMVHLHSDALKTSVPHVSLSISIIPQQKAPQRAQGSDIPPLAKL
jgi:hypothetical protein